MVNKKLKIFHHRGHRGHREKICIVNSAAGAVNKVKLCVLCGEMYFLNYPLNKIVWRLNSDFHASDIAISIMFRLTQDQSIMPNTFFLHKVIFTVDLSVSGQLFKL